MDGLARGSIRPIFWLWTLYTVCILFLGMGLRLFSLPRSFLFLFFPLFILYPLTLFFFRDPERPIGGGVVSPADGIIKDVFSVSGGWLVSIFLNIHNVHVVRSPVRGRVISLTHHPGSHLPAFTKGSTRNERLVVEIETMEGREGDGKECPGGEKLTLTLIAGTLARRIISYIREGDVVGVGERIGLIVLGSRVDVLLPPCVTPVISRGDKVRAGQSTIGMKKAEKRFDGGGVEKIKKRNE